MGRNKLKAWFSSTSPSIGTLSPGTEASWKRLDALRSGRNSSGSRQAKATRQRRGLLARIWPPRRQYLDGLLHGLAAGAQTTE